MKRLLRLAAFPLSLALSVGSSHASTLAYQPIVNMSTGAVAPHYVAVGDFNADGKPDLAVPDFAGKTVSIYLNKGGASFSSPVVTTLSIDNTVGAMVSGDFNEDGKADLAVATFAGTPVVIVLLSNGDGTFAVQPPIPGSFGFLSGKVADFNGDGHADLTLAVTAHPIYSWVRETGVSPRDPLARVPSLDSTRVFPPAISTAIRSWMASRQTLVEMASAPWISSLAMATLWEMPPSCNSHFSRTLQP